MQFKETAIKMSGNQRDFVFGNFFVADIFFAQEESKDLCNLITKRESSLDVLKTLAANLYVVLDSHDKRYDVQRNIS